MNQLMFLLLLTLEDSEWMSFLATVAAAVRVFAACTVSVCFQKHQLNKCEKTA